MKKIKCKHCGSPMPYKNRYIVTDGEMGTQEVLDQKTGETFWGSDSDIINKLIKELNRLDSENNIQK